ncbi:hypothetical protein DFW101_3044 [Solidesulfovibrio carbinoliphilus subsp. oakridgensis]|uniref:Uncharacterized protein n=1 Tax=Solidesulfovibrio carbinoliphilus subsp. oakridgensis TaxID=694327 RepID=G7Q787_9BACT|nr:hypothetical protein [Solidesulfovibrio carbinoliphilus]EHJ49044.1 hypothetical protein DFW101_3044 [Solidesulfovibrio carbinoliphilus subsp. oakridgensis]
MPASFRRARRARPCRALCALVLFLCCCGTAFPVRAGDEPPTPSAPAADAASGPAAPLVLDEASLVAMMHDVIKYYDDTRPFEGRILALLPAYEKNKDGEEYKKLRFLFDTHQKVTTSLNNLIDVLYIYLKPGNPDDQELNVYVYNRSRNIITFLNSMVYFLTARNQEMELGSSSDVQKLYESYLVRLTTLLYELNKTLAVFHK